MNFRILGLCAVSVASLVALQSAAFARGPVAMLGVGTRSVITSAARAGAPAKVDVASMKNPSILVDAQVQASGGEIVGIVANVSRTSNGRALSIDVKLGENGHGGQRAVTMQAQDVAFVAENDLVISALTQKQIFSLPQADSHTASND